MYKQHTVAVVITAYNERNFVGDVVDTVPGFVDRVYVIDDHSTDGSWAEIQQAAAATNERTDETGDDSERVVTIRHDRNRGVGAAIKTGYRRARADRMDVTAVMNGDGQMNPDILHRIVDPVVEGRADYAKGNRLLSRDHVRSMSVWRRFGNGVLTLLTKFASGYWKTMDPQNGYTAVSLDALDALDVDGLYDDYGFLNDVLITLNAHAMRVADVEMEAHYGDEESTIAYSRFIPNVSMLLLQGFLWRLKVRYLVYDFHPLVALYGIGVVGLGGLAARVGVAALGGVSAPSALAMLAVLLVSAFALTLGTTFDLANNEHLEHAEFAEEAGDRVERSPRGSATRSQLNAETD
ncbi:glycosyltransferase family 2 protein [Halobacterium zhouii]|uniref:glycosyltransferase family 2 protein n=1 Tax=Halobacterium zhouii TaxID=2902624 RepID=UPI001E2AE81C|nr:glycosyltransferase family 2 protein [Halobacterium zhouii]